MGEPALDTDPHGFGRLFRSGLDTAQIASRTGCAEAVVVNVLHRSRQARFSPVAPAANDAAPPRARRAPIPAAPNSLKSLYALARRKGFSQAEANAFAQRNKGQTA